VNLELPFGDPEPSELDAYLAEIDHQLDTLFLEEIDAELDRITAERDAPGDLAAGAAS
jgi:hypothetical protein